MADLYTEENGSKRKYLVPLVILLLCAVSLTGAAYAYSSTVTSNDNPVYDDAIIAKLIDKDGNEIEDGDIELVLDWKNVRANGANKWTIDTDKSTTSYSVKIDATTTTAEKGETAVVTFTNLPDYYEIKNGSTAIASGASVTLTEGVATLTISLKAAAEGSSYTYAIEDSANAETPTFNPVAGHDLVSELGIEVVVDNGAHSHTA